MAEEKEQQMEAAAPVQQETEPTEQTPAEQTPTEENAVPEAQVEQCPEQEEKAPAKSGKKKKILIACAVVLCAVLAAIGIVLGKGGKSTANVRFYAVSADLTEDGDAYITLQDGKVIHLTGEISEAAISADRKHVVAVTTDGELFVTDPQLSEKKTVASDCTSLDVVKNDGILYTDGDGDNYRVLFQDLTPLKLGNDLAMAVAEDNINLIYATGSGDICRLLNTETDAEKIGYFSDSVRVKAISNDGSICVWQDKSDDVYTMILWENEEKTTLGKRSGKYDSCFVSFSQDQSIAVIGSIYDSNIWLKRPGKEPVQAQMGAELSESTLYTNDGLLTDATAKNIDVLYAASDADTGMNVYKISSDGDREKILSKVLDYSIAKGTIVYLDSDRGLYTAKLEKGVPTGETKIASDVQTFDLTSNGSYVYYVRNVEDSEGSLYCLKQGQKEPVKISSHAALLSLSYYSRLYNKYSTDGASVWFFQDMEEISGTSTDQGTLMYWHYGDDAPQKISSDVVNYSVTSNLKSGEILPNGYLYMKYTSVDADKEVHGNWMHCDGKKSTKLVTDVIN